MISRQLPVAIQRILPALAADRGRSRAATLYAILGAGPDNVQRHLASIDLALGSGSPGSPSLAELLRKTRETCSPTAPLVRRQHVISKAVLRRFTEPSGTGQQRNLMVRDFKSATTKPIGAGGTGYVMDFVKIDSAATEATWKRVEDKLPAAIDAAEAGSVLSDPTLVQILRNAIALHFARNPQTRDVHERAFDRVYAQKLEEWAATPESEEAFRRAYGLEPAGPEARRLGAEALLASSKELFAKGVLFRLRVQDIYETVCDRFQHNGLEILTPSSSDKEFLIGDAPALTLDFKSGAAGLAKGVALGDANTIILPLAPRVLVALGPANARGNIPDRLVDELNRQQVREARRYVYHRPQADFRSALAAWRGLPDVAVRSGAETTAP